MQTLPALILDSFVALWPALRDHPLELAARLQRRRLALLTRPPRAWCIALRASDTRMTPRDTILDDCHAIEQKRPHTVTITRPLIERLCAPVFIDGWGEPAADVAARLGVNLQGLAYGMRTGLFRVRRVQGLGGKRGKPVPILSYDSDTFGDALDPQSRSFRPPLPAWGSLWPYHASAIPHDFEQPVRRLPDIRPGRWGERFQGWIWHCPACRQRTDKLYYPLPVPSVDVYLGVDIDAAIRGEGGGLRVEKDNADPTDAFLDPLSSTLHPDSPDSLLPPPPTFACGRCHRVTHLSRAGLNSWNELVTHLTAGLLYGREVPKPADWTHRTNTKTRRPHARPAVRRSEVCRLLTETALTRAQLATHLGLSRGTINMHVEDVFDQYGVHSREELREQVQRMRLRVGPSEINSADVQHMTA